AGAYVRRAAAVAVGGDGAFSGEQRRAGAALVRGVSDAVRQGFARGKRRVLVIKAEGVEIPCTRLVRQVQETLGDAEIRAVVLGHLVRGGHPSFLDRMVAARLAYAAVSALLGGASDDMVAWHSPSSGGEATAH